MSGKIICSASLAAILLLSSAIRAETWKTWSDEHLIVKDPDTGIEYVRLTSDKADDSVLYFTGNAYLPRENTLVFASKRDRDKWQLYTVNLSTYVITQITNLGKVGATGAVVCAETHEAFFFDSGALKAADIRTHAVRTVTAVPDGYTASSVSVTDNGKFLAFSISEKVKLLTKTDKIYSDMDEHFDMHPWSAVMTGESNGKGWHEIARQKNWISHTIISPANQDLILYCHEGRWNKVEQRLWLVSSDGSLNRKIRTEERADISIGHEFWYADGIHIGYQGFLPNRSSFVGVADSRTGAFTEYQTPQSNGHTFASADAARFIGDGSAKLPFITLYDLNDDKLSATKLVKHNSDFSRQEWHPHPRISQDNAFVFFTSVTGGGSDINMIRLPKKFK
jgi:oligogalacturonide lyase